MARPNRKEYQPEHLTPAAMDVAVPSDAEYELRTKCARALELLRQFASGYGYTLPEPAEFRQQLRDFIAGSEFDTNRIEDRGTDFDLSRAYRNIFMPVGGAGGPFIYQLWFERDSHDQWVLAFARIQNNYGAWR